MAHTFETVASFGTPVEAGMARGLLASAGIRAFVCDEVVHGILPHMRFALGEVRVQVASEDADKARQVLAEANVPQPPEIMTEDEDGSAPAVRGVLSPEESAQRAWQVALVGLVLVPGFSHLYSLRLAARGLLHPGELSPSGRRRALAALALDVVAIGLLCFLLWRWILEPVEP